MKKIYFYMVLLFQILIGTLFVGFSVDIGVSETNAEVESPQYSTFSNASIVSDGFGGINWNDGYSNDASIAIDKDGFLHVVWYDGTDGPWGSDEEIWYAKYDPNSSWSNATLISDGYDGSFWNDGSSRSPEVAIGPNGTIHVVWQDSTEGPWGTDLEIMYVQYKNDSGWSNATIISDGFNGNYWNNDFSAQPDIVTSEAGIVYVVWHDDTTGPWSGGISDSEIFFVQYIPKMGWTNVSVVSDGYKGTYYNDGNSYSPTIELDDMRNIHVAWSDNTEGPWGLDYEILYTTYNVEEGWMYPQVVSDGFGGKYWNDAASLSPEIAVGTNGTIHIVWEDLTSGKWGSDEEIWYVKYQPFIGWLNATLISDGYGGGYWNDGISSNPSIATDGTGNIHVGWQDTTADPWGTDYDIMYTKYIDELGWIHPYVISDGYNGSYWNDDSSFAPSIASDLAGDVYVVWDDDTDGSWGTDEEIMFTYTDSYEIQDIPQDSNKEDQDEDQSIPFGNFYLIGLLIGIIGLILVLHSKIKPKNQ